MHSLSRTDPVKTINLRVPSPGDQIHSYLGVSLNEKTCYLVVRRKGNVCYLNGMAATSFREPDKICSIQANIFQRVIKTLRSETPLKPISKMHWEEGVGLRISRGPDEDVKEILPDIHDAFFKHLDNINVDAKVLVITGIFMMKIMDCPKEERTHRELLATLLEYHMRQHIDPLPPPENKTPKFSLRLRGDEEHLSPREGTKRQKLSLPLSKKRSSAQDVKQEARLLNVEQKNALFTISPKARYALQQYWLNGSKFEAPCKKDANIIQKTSLLKTPRMHLIVKLELISDLFQDINLCGLAGDIQRDFSYYSVVSNCKGGKDLKRELMAPDASYNIQCTAFYQLLSVLIENMEMRDGNTILAKWKTAVAKEEDFVSAGERFLNKLNYFNSSEKQIYSLIVLLRQKNYKHELLVIRQILQKIPLDFKHQPNRFTEFRFFPEEVQCHISHMVSLKKQQERPIFEFPYFEIEVVNRMSALRDLLKWNSKLDIIVKANKDSKEVIIQHIHEPLSKVGFKLKSVWTKAKPAASISF